VQGGGGKRERTNKGIAGCSFYLHRPAWAESARHSRAAAAAASPIAFRGSFRAAMQVGDSRHLFRPGRRQQAPCAPVRVCLFDQDAPTSSAQHLRELVPSLCCNDFVHHLFCCAGQISTRVKFWYESHSVGLFMYSISLLELNFKPTQFHKEFGVTVIVCPA